ncbi:TatD family hydrolase [Candidatus Microgenomates bacterium]|nr:TatD family hydrolase [Candidatus Microgenomates bacterium]
MIFDTHAHIHFDEYRDTASEVLERAKQAQVSKIICVGTSDEDSSKAIEFVKDKDECVATVGLHPHQAKLSSPALKQLAQLVNDPKVVAVGECGLDYNYMNSPKSEQEKSLRFQIELALAHQKPLIFHVREAFEDFFRIVDNYQNLQGVVHSFSSTPDNLHEVLARGYYVGLNGIMTFTKDAKQLAAARQVPLGRLLLETDCPFLTPVPNRGKINEPANVRAVAEFLAKLRSQPLKKLAQATTANAAKLFSL